MSNLIKDYYIFINTVSQITLFLLGESTILGKKTLCSSSKKQKRTFWDALMKHQVASEIPESVQQLQGDFIMKNQINPVSNESICIFWCIKQGCPLFLLLIDVVMEKTSWTATWSRNGLVKLDAQCIAMMEFDKNLVLATEEGLHMNINLHECGRLFDQKGLRVKVKKCTSLSVCL